MLRHKWAGKFFLAMNLILSCAVGHADAKLPGVSHAVEKRKHKQTGIASFYHERFHGRRTANGERYNKEALSACHAKLPFGTLIRITNLHNSRSTEVRINDHNKLKGGRILDISTRAARELGMMRTGIAKVELEVLAWGGAD